MTKAQSQAKICTVELTADIFVKTPIPSENHSALRAGFAGYTMNPRWNNTKVLAWKTGRRWRQALDQGDLAVRPQDLMLVPAAELQPTLVQPEQTSTSAASKTAKAPFCLLPNWKRIFAMG